MKLYFYKFDRVTLFVVFTFLILYVFSFFPEISFTNSLFGEINITRVDLTSDFDKSNVVYAFKTDITNVDASKKSENKTISEGENNLNYVSEKKNENQVHGKTLICEDKTVIPFEDYSKTNELQKIVSDLKSLRNGKRKMRIAFLGDSFIEADIMTEGVRSQLQEVFGGRGVGFIPITSLASKYRKTIEQGSCGWKSFSMVKYKEADYKRLIPTGFYYTPSEGSTFFIKTKKVGGEDTKYSSARFIFVNEKNTEIQVSINGAIHTSYKPDSDERLQTIDLKGDISSLDFSFSNTDDFYGYGLLLNDTNGIYVDNYSVRGSSGIVLSTSNENLSRQYASIVPTDVIVLQYGLNVAGANVLNYNYYKKKMIEIINKLRTIFPMASFIVMGVGDRSMKINNTIETMPGIIALIESQREIAKTAGCIFWDTFNAMGGKNSMLSFISHNPPLASKDYTHINHLGGQQLSKVFVNSLLNEVQTFSLTSYKEEED